MRILNVLHGTHKAGRSDNLLLFYQFMNLKRLKTTNVQHLTLKFWCTQL